jgi:hypothetical protein
LREERAQPDKDCDPQFHIIAIREWLLQEDFAGPGPP